MSTSITKTIFIFLAITLSWPAFSQKNTEIDESKEGIVVIPEIKDTLAHSPKVAAYLSMALPGLGQVYNKKYWKVPIIYAGFGTLTYFIIDNNKNYVKFRDAYIARIDTDPTNDDVLPEYTTENLRVIKNYYWNNRDLNIILCVVLYALNIVDAVVDAHFYTYDISDDLSFNISPIVEPSMGFGRTSSTAVSFSLNF